MDKITKLVVQRAELKKALEETEAAIEAEITEELAMLKETDSLKNLKVNDCLTITKAVRKGKFDINKEHMPEDSEQMNIINERVGCELIVYKEGTEYVTKSFKLPKESDK